MTTESDRLPPRKRDALRAERNKRLIDALTEVVGVRDSHVFQLEDHTDKGYLMYVTFDEKATSAAEILDAIRAAFADLLPEVPYWGQMLTEADDSVGFGYAYIDHNKLFR